tara:strand:- start:458 stop:865 length:408 start_codon:yes stop_codon:yes gene_type:complete
MSVRVVRTRSGDDVICDLFEVTTKDDTEKPVAFQLVNAYYLYLVDPNPEIEIEGGGEINKISKPEIKFEPYAPFCKEDRIMVKLDEVVTAYETHDEIIKKYNQLVEATRGRGDDATAVESNTAETEIGISVREGD